MPDLGRRVLGFASVAGHGSLNQQPCTLTKLDPESTVYRFCSFLQTRSGYKRTVQRRPHSHDSEQSAPDNPQPQTPVPSREVLESIPVAFSNIDTQEDQASQG